MPGQIRDTNPKTGQMGVPGELSFFFRDMSLKIGTIPENPGRMLTLYLSRHLKWVYNFVVILCKFSLFSLYRAARALRLQPHQPHG